MEAVMNYPKMYMSKTELQDIGLPRRMIGELANLPGGKSAIRRGKGGKVIFDTRKLDADIELWQKAHR